jgi:serine/threonine-protein kinase
MTLLGRDAGASLLFAFVLWMFYLALEPYVRRFWPRSLISWTRLLGSGPGNPLVGRDVLFGMAYGGATAVLILAVRLFATWSGQPEPPPSGSNLKLALSPRYAAGAIVDIAFSGLVLAMGSLLLLLVFKLVLRKEWLAAWLLVAVLTLIQALSLVGAEVSPWWNVSLAFVLMASYTLLLRHAGLVACIVGVVTINLLLSFPLTLDLEAWNGGVTVLALGFAAALGGYALRTAVYAAPARSR